MRSLENLLAEAVERGTVPGVAALAARGDEVEIAAAGELASDAIVRIASITKPITVATVMLVVDEGRVSPADPVSRWLPELAALRSRPHTGEPDRRCRCCRP